MPEPASSSVATAREVRVTVGRVRRALREHYDHAELTASQTAVLSRLDREGAATAAELAAAERVKPQSMSATVAVLLERGLVQRTPDASDRRRMLLSLTDAAKAWIVGGRQHREGWLAEVLHEQLTAEERETVHRAMALLDRAIQS